MSYCKQSSPPVNTAYWSSPESIPYLRAFFYL